MKKLTPFFAVGVCLMLWISQSNAEMTKEESKGLSTLQERKDYPRLSKLIGILLKKYPGDAALVKIKSDLITSGVWDDPELPVPPVLSKADQKISSRALGIRTGNDFVEKWAEFGVDVSDLDVEEFLDGYLLALKGGGASEADVAEMNGAVERFSSMVQEREKRVTALNLEIGKDFLAANAKRPEVAVTKTGLQYEILNEGGSDRFMDLKEDEQNRSQIWASYEGMLLDGTVTDSSPGDESMAFTPPLQLIEGFKEALTTMPVGAKWKIFVPSELGYGSQRSGSKIGPNSVLIFEIHLAKIARKPE